MGFRYQAIDAAGQTCADVVEAASPDEAAATLRERGLFVTRLEGLDARESAKRGSPAGGRVKFRDIVLFTQQMAMLLRSGARVTEALEIIEDQGTRSAWAQVVARLHRDVQEGRPLSAALARYPKLFAGVFVSMVTAGEASGELALAFDRLAILTRQQQEIRNRIVGAISYPAALLVLCAGVLVIMFAFVLPRFAEMFDALGVDLPITTAMLIAGSFWSQEHWLLLVVLIAAAVTGAVLFLRSPTGRRSIALAAVRVPLVGGLVRNIIFARLCRIWGQLLESKVSLLDAVDLIRQGTSHPDFQQLLNRITAAVTEGRRIGLEFRESWLVLRTYAGAIATGEESGRLTESLLFAAASLEDQNAQALDALTRILEPLILAVMGVVVGILAFSLFLPMFDMATVANG